MTDASNTAHTLASQLLEAQVEFFKQQLSGADASAYFERTIDFLLSHANELSLDECVSSAHVKEVVKVYAFDLNLGAGILELIGAIAQRIYGVMTHTSPNLDALMGQHIEQWIEKILELDHVRAHLFEAIQQSPTALRVINQIIASIINSHRAEWHRHTVLPNWIEKNPLSKKIKSLLHLQEDKLLLFTEQKLAQFIQQQTQHLQQLEHDDLKDIAIELWQSIRHMPLNELSEGISALDIEEFFVLVYELWRHLRQTDYVQQLILTGVDVFFECYGQYPIAELLQEVAVTRQHIINDANRFLPNLIQAANQHGILDKLIRLHLSEFYQSPTTLKLIEQATAPLA